MPPAPSRLQLIGGENLNRLNPARLDPRTQHLGQRDWDPLVATPVRRTVVARGQGDPVALPRWLRPRVETRRVTGGSDSRLRSIGAEMALRMDATNAPGRHIANFTMVRSSSRSVSPNGSAHARR